MSKPSTCKKCQGRIWWKWGQEGKYPINSDGTKHWPKCRKPYTGPLVVYKGKTVGEDYRPFSHLEGCDALPWEKCDCPESAADAANREADERLQLRLKEPA